MVHRDGVGRASPSCGNCRDRYWRVRGFGVRGLLAPRGRAGPTVIQAGRRRQGHELGFVRQIDSWHGHDRGMLEKMTNALRLLREQGRDVVED